MLEVHKLGKWDRAARVVTGAGLLAVAGRARRVDLWTLGGAVAGTALLVTGFVGGCMFYPLLGQAYRRCGR